MRIVLDANVLISGVFWSGPPFRILELWANGVLHVLASDPIMREYAATLGVIARERGEIRLAEAWTAFVFQHAVLVDVHSTVDVCRDPDDNKYLACALDGGAAVIVSGDKDLLVLKSYGSIPVVTARMFLDAYT